MSTIYFFIGVIAFFAIPTIKIAVQTSKNERIKTEKLHEDFMKQLYFPNR